MLGKKKPQGSEEQVEAVLLKPGRERWELILLLATQTGEGGKGFVKIRGDGR